MIDYNVDVLSPDLQHAFFHLDRADPTAGFAFDATAHYGPTWPEVTEDSTEDIRLVLASHLAGYLRHKILEKGYAATVGISSSKLLAKLIGNVHKPNNQTTLLPSSSNITRFLDDHQIKQIPGIGSKMAEKLHVHLAGGDGNPNLTVRDVRQAPGMGPAVLDRLWHGPGSSRGIGMRIWGFLHGMDSSDVMEARDLPSQISIEDTYGRLDRLDAVKLELVKLASSLLRRMRVDLTTTTTTSSSTSSTSSWRAHPRTLRLSSRLRTSDPANPYLPRSSRSAPLPSFVFSLEDRVEALAERLVHEHLLTLFRRLHPEKNGWALSLLNIAVTNMVDGVDHNRDIGALFRRQTRDPVSTADPVSTSPVWDDVWEDDSDEDTPSGIQCARCRATIPWFAVQAHEQYHQVPD